MNTLIAIIGLGVLCLLFEIMNFRKAIIPVTILGLIGILGLTLSEINSPATYHNNMIVVNKFSVAFSSLFIVLTIFLVALSHNFYEKCDDCTDEITCSVRRLMMEIRDNTLIILENNSLADIAF